MLGSRAFGSKLGEAGACTGSWRRYSFFTVASFEFWPAAGGCGCGWPQRQLRRKNTNFAELSASDLTACVGGLLCVQTQQQLAAAAAAGGAQDALELVERFREDRDSARAQVGTRTWSAGSRQVVCCVAGYGLGNFSPVCWINGLHAFSKTHGMGSCAIPCSVVAQHRCRLSGPSTQRVHVPASKRRQPRAPIAQRRRA